jgi:hypothetical protein
MFQPSGGHTRVLAGDELGARSKPLADFWKAQKIVSNRACLRFAHCK